MSRALKMISMSLILALFINSGAGVIESVTFETKPTDGSQSTTSSPKVTGDTPTSGKTSGGSLLYSLDAPQSQKDRLAASIENLHSTSVQAAMALKNLKDLDGKTVPTEEMLARLVHAQECFSVVESAAKKLEGDVELVRMACEKDPSLKQEVMAMLEGLFASPAMAAYMDRFPSVNRGSKKEWPSFMDTLKSAAKTVGNVASTAGNALKSGVQSVVGAVGKAHDKIGSVVGQKTWATIMSGVKFTATVAGGVVAICAIPATATVGTAVAGVAILGTTVVGGLVSLGNDLSTIHGGANIDGIDNAMTRINQGAGAISLGVGLARGDVTKVGEVVVGVMGIGANEIANALPGNRDMTDEEANQYLPPAHQIRVYKKPTSTGGPGGDGGGGGSSGGCGGCP